MSKLRARLSYANVMATIAVFIALGGTTYAISKLPKNSVGTKQIKKDAVKGSKVAKDSLTGTDIEESTLDTVPSAVTAQRAVEAQGAANAQTLGGLSATQVTDASKVGCPAGMQLAVGICFESVARDPKALFVAMSECGLIGRRLPSQGELIAFRTQLTVPPPEEWAEPLLSGATQLGAIIATGPGGATLTFKPASEPHPYRCMVSATN